MGDLSWSGFPFLFVGSPLHRNQKHMRGGCLAYTPDSLIKLTVPPRWKIVGTFFTLTNAVLDPPQRYLWCNGLKVLDPDSYKPTFPTTPLPPKTEDLQVMKTKQNHNSYRDRVRAPSVRPTATCTDYIIPSTCHDPFTDLGHFTPPQVIGKGIPLLPVLKATHLTME